MNIPFYITKVKTVDPEGRMIPEDALLTAEDIAKSDAELNAGLPEYWPAGTLIHSPGYAVVKEKALDGSWVQM